MQTKSLNARISRKETFILSLERLIKIVLDEKS